MFLDESYETYSDGQIFGHATEAAETTKRGEGDHEKARIAAARRAKTKVRRLAKMLEADCSLTLTYRECMTDYARVKADFKAFRERLRSLGEFHYVATLEVHQRGALHVHIACQQFPAWLKNEHGMRVRSWNLIRSMWRRVVGKDNGNADFTRPRGRNTAHRIASYISKYVSKNLEEARFNRKSYWASRGIPNPQTIPLNEDAMRVLLARHGAHPVYVFTCRGNKIIQASTAAWYQALERAGIQDFRWHDLRHTWASWHVQSGTPLLALQELGGWESFDMVRRYAHFSQHYLSVFAANLPSMILPSS
ncbi:site-specific integrase [Herbaspirillum sp. alder98]|uniref:site-specific integrase n=1 Tax=Herbaspirillum sp. alder98 TaxID=2913096 RepID=UPI001CD8D7B9|nr:site-specific integrase [Herbaspirillum sp. alder98]MCA1324765.1 site-specific integrase [Herbaspirillum sp. alder98]